MLTGGVAWRRGGRRKGCQSLTEATVEDDGRGESGSIGMSGVDPLLGQSADRHHRVEMERSVLLLTVGTVGLWARADAKRR